MLTLEKFKKFYFHNWLDFSQRQDLILNEIELNEDEEAKILNASGLIYEQLEILKLNTVLNYRSLSAYYKKEYYNLITSLETPCDELGIIEKLGVRLSKEEFEAYDKLIDEIYKEKTK